MFVALRIPLMREAAMLPTTRPTPTCAHFRVADLPCTTCGNKMRLILSEPRSQRFELMTYRCDCCGNVESFLSAIWAGQPAPEHMAPVDLGGSRDADPLP
jgi:hypothetical protein